MHCTLTPAPVRTRSAWRPVRMLFSCSAERPPKTTVALLTTIAKPLSQPARPPNPRGLRVVVGQVVLVEDHVTGRRGRHHLPGRLVPAAERLRPARLAGAQRGPVGAADDDQPHVLVGRGGPREVGVAAHLLGSELDHTGGHGPDRAALADE